MDLDKRMLVVKINLAIPHANDYINFPPVN